MQPVTQEEIRRWKEEGPALMATVIDASVMGAQLLPDDRYGDSARRILEQLDTEERIAPIIFWYEICNVLLTAKRRKRIDQRHFDACLIQLTDELSLCEDTERDEATVLNLAQRHDLTVYDASYLETASGASQAGDLRPKTATAASKKKSRTRRAIGAINAE